VNQKVGCDRDRLHVTRSCYAERQSSGTASDCPRLGNAEAHGPHFSSVTNNVHENLPSKLWPVASSSARTVQQRCGGRGAGTG
jgi:hypothetical protein